MRNSETWRTAPERVRPLAQRGDRLTRSRAWKEVLRLDLGPGARGESHPEVREPVRPAAGDAELRRAVHRVQAEDGVALDDRRCCTEACIAQVTILHPELPGVIPPLGEDRHALARREDVGRIFVQGRPRQALVDALGDLVRRLGVERDPRDGPERAEAHDDAREVRIAAPEADDLPRRGHELERADGRREVAVAVSRTVGRRGDRARHRDVRQRREVVQRAPVRMQRLGQLAVADGAAAGHPVVADLDRCRQPLQRDELTGVGDGVEGVARAEDADPLRARDQLRQLVHRRRAMDPRGGVGVVPRPVRLPHARDASARRGRRERRR